MLNVRLYAWICTLTVLILFKAEAEFVNITYVECGVANGAVCLDGSPPAYHLSRGSGSGNNSWLVQLEGGGWCNNLTTCLARKNTRLGSSKQMATQLAFSGILSNSQAFNPDFYNWNRVKIRYCDGSSFTGDVEKVDPVTNLHYRGARVWRAVMEDLLAQGMSEAENALLSGCSAGGLASILHCDSFRDFLPESAKGSTKNLPHCSSTTEPGLCFFPQYMAQGVDTQLFILNAAYDSWQIRNILVPGSADPRQTWKACKLDINQCSRAELEIIQGYRMDFLNALNGLGNLSSRGLFINSCFVHCQSETQETWFAAGSPMLNKTRIATAVADWFYNLFRIFSDDSQITRPRDAASP